MDLPGFGSPAKGFTLSGENSVAPKAQLGKPKEPGSVTAVATKLPHFLGATKASEETKIGP